MAHFSLFLPLLFVFKPNQTQAWLHNKATFMHNILLKHGDTLLQKKITTFLKMPLFVPLYPVHGTQWLRLWGALNQSIINSATFILEQWFSTEGVSRNFQGGASPYVLYNIENF